MSVLSYLLIPLPLPVNGEGENISYHPGLRENNSILHFYRFNSLSRNHAHQNGEQLFIALPCRDGYIKGVKINLIGRRTTTP